MDPPPGPEDRARGSFSKSASAAGVAGPGEQGLRWESFDFLCERVCRNATLLLFGILATSHADSTSNPDSMKTRALWRTLPDRYGPVFSRVCHARSVELWRDFRIRGSAPGFLQNERQQRYVDWFLCKVQFWRGNVFGDFSC